MSISTVISNLLPRPLRNSIRAIRQYGHLWDLLLSTYATQLCQNHPNPLNRFGQKCFSQTDEDGITIEILKRIGSLESGYFAEFGVGNGTENNTLILKALGWKGFWIGGQDLAFSVKQPREQFCHIKAWITRANIISLANQGKDNLGCDQLDVISLDLDGNDIYFVEELLRSGYTPKLFIVEYNAKFIPPVRWQIAYDDNHKWQIDDYFGASLQSFVDLFSSHSYRLVCCNAQTGANAFFVREEYSHLFDDIPREIERLFFPPRYFLYRQYGHKASIKTVAQLFS